MARQRKSARPRQAEKQIAPKSWSSLTWDDLDHWAGSRSVSRGQAYQRQGRVKNLALAEDGRLLATVVGNERYVTSAWLVPGKGKGKQVESVCSCPVGASGCKHAVAAVADFLAALAEKRAVPAAEPDDQRWVRLSQDDDDSDDEFDDDDFDESDADDDDDANEMDDEVDIVPAAAKRSKPAQDKLGTRGKRLTRADWDQKIKTHVEQKSREDLAGLVLSLVDRFPELRQEFQERIALGEGDVDQLLAAARRELRSVTGEFGWRNHWQGEGHTPNYSRLKHRLERLSELGHCEAVVELGRELVERGMEQVGQSDDEGETAMELSDCLPVVFDALAKSKLSAPDKILYAIDACLKDGYDVIGDAAGKILGGKWSSADWSVVADRLAKRLQKATPKKGQDDFSRNYQRDCISNYVLEALDRAGRKKELLALHEAEARETGSYQRLVSYLIAQDRCEEAERWAREGIEKTHQKWPGIASGLAQSLCEVARRNKQWDVVAAHAALQFLEHPSVLRFKELLAAAKKAKCQEPVRAAALQFLESGVAPIRITVGRKDSCTATIDPAWPLPVPDYLIPKLSGRLADPTPQPHYSVLLDMAIEDKRPADVLRWHDKMTAREKHTNRGPHYWVQHFDSDRVAKAVAAAYPERALEIYQRKLDSHLKSTGTSAYETCADCLRNMRPIFKVLDQEDRWDELLVDIRHNYRNRPRFMETLDKLDGRTIVESHKPSRRR
jgi:uncharacterized Zn finger protein